MAMTPTQVEQLVNQSPDPQSAGGDDPLGGSGSGGNYADSLDLNKQQWLANHGINPFTATDVEIAYALYAGGQGGPEELKVLKDAGLITGTQAGNDLLPPDLTSRYSFHAPTKYAPYWTKQDKQTGAISPLSDAEAAALGLAGGSSGGSGGAGGVGIDHYATDAASANAANQLAFEYAQLEEKKNEFGLTFPEQQREFDLQQQLANRNSDATILHNRATAGLSLGDLVRGLANDAYSRAADPGNFPAYLASIAGLPQGSGSPVSKLLGQGVQIQSPEGSNPLADPRFQKLLDSEYTYGTVPDPAGVGTVRSIADANGGTLPQSFYDYTHTQNPNVPAHATGGTQMLSGPTVGIPANQLVPGQKPEFLAGEAGQEKLTFTPMSIMSGATPHPGNILEQSRQQYPWQYRIRDTLPSIGGGVQPPPNEFPTSIGSIGGSIPNDFPQVPSVPQFQPVHTHTSEGMSIPHQHAMGDVTHEHTGPNSQPSFKHYAMGGTALTPAQGTDEALGKALDSGTYGEQGMRDQLNSGNGPTPGSVDESTWENLSPSMKLLLQAGIKAQLGRSGLMDWLDEMNKFALPGAGNGGYTNTVYA